MTRREKIGRWMDRSDRNTALVHYSILAVIGALLYLLMWALA